MTQTMQPVEPVPTNGSKTPAAAPAEKTVTVRRRTVDTLLVAAGVVVAAVLAAAGVLLTWGNNFAEDYVGDELTAQHIYFPDQATLQDEGRSDLVAYAGEQVTTGAQAEAYASYIDGHLAKLADGATYADMGPTVRAAQDAVTAAQDAGQDQATITQLQATADELSGQRDSLFKGETLRGLLLSTFAWSTIGRIAGIAAIVAFIAAGVMIVLVVAGLIHRSRTATA